ncbi:conserved protein of unknown function (plasmid) [Cupriavidus taiwanensis]|uniref:Uncharacterized protein n=1 Tax=Cupriavidus taiwanensis TaxID=164546 RepID=A0A375IRM8_9BURK|nr:conserved protein of unknown function [Cupriavidus taiwanensis]
MTPSSRPIFNIPGETHKRYRNGRHLYNSITPFMGNEADRLWGGGGVRPANDEITVMGRRNNARGELDCSSAIPLAWTRVKHHTDSVLLSFFVFIFLKPLDVSLW